MSRKPSLSDVKTTRAAVDEFKEDKTPTLAGLMRLLKLKSIHTLYSYLDKDTDIGDIMKEAYLHIIEMHEKKLYGSSAAGSIFALKNYRKLGFEYRDNHEEIAAKTKFEFSYNIVDVKDKDAN